MYKLLRDSSLPKWLKWLLYIVITITCIYWLGVMLYKLLEALRKFLHWASDKRNWWTFLTCIFILLIGSLLISQFALGLNPFGKFINWIVNQWTEFRNWLGSIVSSNK